MQNMSESLLSIVTNSDEPSNTIVPLEECLHYQASHQAETEAYIFYNGEGLRTSITFSELYKKCKELGCLFKHLGMKTNDVVIMAQGNSIEFPIIYFGLMMMGAIPFSLLVTKKNCSDILDLVEKSEAVALIVPTVNKCGRDFNLDELIENAKNTNLLFIISSDSETHSPGCLSLKRLLESMTSHDPLITETINIDNVAVIMQTSGTTGTFKLVCHSYRNLFNIMKCKETIFFPNSQKLFCAAHFAWLGGSPMKEVFNGTTRVSITGDKWRMNVEDMLHVAGKEMCNILELSPDSIHTIILRNIPIPKSVKYILTGGAPISQNFQKILESVDCLIVGYGLIETGGISGTYFTKKKTVEANIGGKPRCGVSVKIVDDYAKIVKRGVDGKIMVKTPYACLPFSGKNGSNASEWVNTDDIGYISEKGELFVLGRQADCITIGTVTVYACHIEQTILSCAREGIVEVIIVPIPDNITYQQVCACIIKKPDTILTEQSILQKVNEIELSTRKPKYILFVDSFPRNQNNKIDRRAMQEIAMQKLNLI